MRPSRACPVRCAGAERRVRAQGHMKAAPTVVPEKNPVSGQPNAFYGWSTPAQAAAKADNNAAHEE